MSKAVFGSVKVILIALLLSLLIRSTLFEPFRIPSGSMLPTLEIGDFVLVNKFSYGYSRYSVPFGLLPFAGRVLEQLPQRGEVSIFRNPVNPSIPYIKRIVGLPGDRIQLRKGRLYINDRKISRVRLGDYSRPQWGPNFQVAHYREEDSSLLPHQIIEIYGDNGRRDNTPVYQVPEGYLFALGDNRDNSQDSRYMNQTGFIPVENLVGRATRVLFSFDVDAGFGQWFRGDRFFKAIQ